MSSHYKLIVFSLLVIKCTILIVGVGGAVLYPWENEASKSDQWTRTGQVNFTLGNFTIFNNPYSQAFVFKKGVITFENTKIEDLDFMNFHLLEEGSALFTPAIIPFYGQADITSPQRGRLQYIESTNSSLLQIATKDVLIAFPGLKNVNLNWIFMVTWVDIAFWEPEYYYNAQNCNCGNRRNTFQAVLTTDGVRSFVILNYNKMTWVKSPWADGKGNNGVAGPSTQPMCFGGNSSGVAGFDTGDASIPLQTLPGSYTESLINITKLSNINQPGKWVFRVDQSLQSSSCDFAEDVEQIRINPSWLPYLGSIPIAIKGPCLDNVTNIMCTFYDGPYKTRAANIPFSVPGELVEEKGEVRCNAPIFYSISGSVKVELSFTFHSVLADGTQSKQEKKFYGFVYTYKPMANVDFHVLENGDVELKWNPAHFLPIESMLELNLVELDWSSPDLRKAISSTLKMTLTNSGSYLWPLGTTGFFKNHKSAYFVYLRKVEENSPNPTRIYSHVVYTNYKQTKEKYIQLCDEWYKKDKGPPENLMPCPPRLEQVQWDWSFQRQLVPPTKNTVFFQRVPNSNGSAQRCIYDNDGVLLTRPPEAGTAFMSSPNGNGSFTDHHINDVLPHYLCCVFSQDSDSCLKYYDKRPADPGTNYIPPKVSILSGDPHITTLDSASYTFNGVGEFWMVISPNLRMQARMSQFVHPITKVKRNASIFTAVAIHQKLGNSEVWVQVEINPVGISVWLDKEEISIGMGPKGENSLNINKAGVSIILKLRNSSVSSEDNNVIDRVTLVFSSGFSFDITVSDGVALNLIASCISNPTTKGKLSGLLGNFDGNATNDLKDPSGLQIPLNSTLEDIHHSFGVKWRTSLEESLFLYKAGKTHDDYQYFNFVPNYKFPNTSSLPAEARSLCGNSRECLYDYFTTGSLSFANGTREAGKQFQYLVEALKKKPYPYPCPDCSSTNAYDPTTEGNDDGHHHDQETTTSKVSTTTKKSAVVKIIPNPIVLLVFICTLLTRQ